MSESAIHTVQVKAEFLIPKSKKIEASVIPSINIEESNTQNHTNQDEIEIAYENEETDEIIPTSSSGVKVDISDEISGKSKRKRGDTRPDPSSRLCLAASRGETCTVLDCKYLHDITAYLASKPPDLGPECVVFDKYGVCSSGLMCRFGSGHINSELGVSIRRAAEHGGVIEKENINVLRKELQVMLRKKKYIPTPNTTPIITSSTTTANTPATGGLDEAFNTSAYADRVKLVDFSNKVYVAPLTTVGNLPFRRILKEFGADITCGEMALSQNLEQGHPSEWALLRRHSSEDVFGIQIAGSHADQLRRLAKVIEHETYTDFVDLNCGCPIDLVCNKGCGSSLLTKPTRLLDIVASMTSVLTRPMTIKLRTGWDDKNLNAHKLIPMLQKMAKGKIAAVMIHGRSRLQRYHKAANWNYILEAAQAQDPSYPLLPIIGNGDILTIHDWRSHQAMLHNSIEDTETIGLCSCAMLGRGAIIKPWLPQEIKSNSDIDISSGERLDILKKFVHYGLDHWGSDQQGVNTTRRFLLEWLSFLHRYVPIGILEHIQGMQQRPPRYYGRNDLETLLSSPAPENWVKISEILLGKVPEDFHFEPKHKSNAYEGEMSNQG